MNGKEDARQLIDEKFADLDVGEAGDRCDAHSYLVDFITVLQDQLHCLRGPAVSASE